MTEVESIDPGIVSQDSGSGSDSKQDVCMMTGVESIDPGMVSQDSSSGTQDEYKYQSVRSDM